jgi:transforming growth factor-beta-induced protein
MRKLGIVVVLVASLMLAIMPARAAGGTVADTVVSLATSSNPEFSILLAAVQAADPSILAALSDPSAQLTVFAPTDRAFVALLNGMGMTAEQLLGNRALLNRVLQYHVLGGVFDQQAVFTVGDQFVPTLLSNDGLLVTLNKGTIYVDASRVITPDIRVSNGIIHVIDTVLVPDGINGNNVTERNRANFAARIAQNEIGYRTIYGNVVTLATGSEPQFTILLAAIQNADPAVTAALDNLNGNLTVFAPTDAAFLAAFEALGVTPQQVLADRALLTNILLYHVVPGRVFSGDLSTGAVTTLNGAAVEVRVGGGVRVNDARVISANIGMLNGVVHVIDSVLLPPQ